MTSCRSASHLAFQLKKKKLIFQAKCCHIPSVKVKVAQRLRLHVRSGIWVGFGRGRVELLWCFWIISSAKHKEQSQSKKHWQKKSLSSTIKSDECVFTLSCQQVMLFYMHCKEKLRPGWTERLRPIPGRGRCRAQTCKHKMILNGSNDFCLKC